MIEQFHFIRPQWLVAIIPLLLIAWFLFKQTMLSRSWQSVIDPALLPHLLSKQGKQHKNHFMIVIFFIAALATILSLAGPAWKKLPQPVFKQASALVIALDLSRSMDAGDVKPSRLIRARLKIIDLLKLRKEGQSALIAYAADAFTVTPLTDDTETIAALLPSLSSDIMPAQGSRSDLALAKAGELLSNAGIAHGDILLVTDGTGSDAESAIKKQLKKGHRVSILAIGTVDGAPIPLTDGGFLKDANGSIVIPKLDLKNLQTMSLLGHGIMQLMSFDDRDIQKLQTLFSASRLKSDKQASELQTDLWQEQGYWLLLLVIPLALLIFRRGYLALLFFIILPMPQSADALSWDELWLNNNQQAAQALEKNELEKAAELFNDPAWKASAQFKNGQFDQAAENFSKINSADGFYNQGNALAKAGKLEEAIKSYDQALKIQPDHADAQFNKQQIEKQKQQQSDKSSDDSKDKSDQQDSSDQKKQSEQNKSQDKQSNQSSKENESSEKQSNETDSEQQKSSSKNQESQQNAENKENNENKKSAQEKAQQAEQNADQPQTEDSDQTDEPETLSEQAAKQWLRRIPDDPGGLLRNKFKYQYQRQKHHLDETKNW